LHRLAASFVLGYHGCDAKTADRLLRGEDFRPSKNDYDWLGSGIYFWEANPARGLAFAAELKKLKRGPKIDDPAVVGAVIDLGLCLDLTTSAGIQQVKDSHREYAAICAVAGYPLPANDADLMRRNLDCAVIDFFHATRQKAGLPAVDSVRALFMEGRPIYEGSGFLEKTHVQICVCNPDCIKGVFRVPRSQLVERPAP